MSNELVPLNDIKTMAAAVAKSNLFGVKTEDEALALMLLAQSEGMHPATAARDYHIIQGRPALKSDAMLARYFAGGGKIQWHDFTDNLVSATFEHPQGGTVKVEWDIARATNAGLSGKDMWKKYPRQMLRARVISEGVRMTNPGVAIGVYTAEEASDGSFEEVDITPVVDITPKPKKHIEIVKENFNKETAHKTADLVRAFAAIDITPGDLVEMLGSPVDNLSDDMIKMARDLYKQCLKEYKARQAGEVVDDPIMPDKETGEIV